MFSTTHKLSDKMTALGDKKITFYHKSDICSNFKPNLGIYHIRVKYLDNRPMSYTYFSGTVLARRAVQ